MGEMDASNETGAGPMSERPMAEEHIWQDDGETLRATGKGGWYREGEDWRRANSDWFARFARLELLRMIVQRDALGAVVQGFFADHLRLAHAPGAYCRCEHWAQARDALRAAGLLPEEGA